MPLAAGTAGTSRTGAHSLSGQRGHVCAAMDGVELRRQADDGGRYRGQPGPRCTWCYRGLQRAKQKHGKA